MTAAWGTLRPRRNAELLRSKWASLFGQISRAWGSIERDSIDGVGRLRLIGDFLVRSAVNPSTDRVENYVYGTVCASTGSTRKSRIPPPAGLLGLRDGKVDRSS